MRTRADIESLGFTVIATTTHTIGVSYDAHYVDGKRFLVRGTIENTPERAMDTLCGQCEERL